MTTAKLRYIFVAGIEGCGHHGLNPVLSKALAYSESDGRPPVIIRNKKRLKRILNWYWCKSHPLPLTKYLVRKMINRFFRREKEKSRAENSYRIIIEDNSFPGGRYRDPDKQWDIIEMVDIVGQYADDILIIGLYRDPIAATFSHLDFDGGLLAHAEVVKDSLIYVNDQLEKLTDIKKLFIHYEDLVDGQDKLAPVISDFLSINADDVRLGLKEIRSSSKNWRNSLSEEEQGMMLAAFNSKSEKQWPLFSQSKKYSDQDS